MSITISIINLKESGDRRLFQQSQLNDLGLEGNYSHAVTPADFSSELYEQLSKSWQRLLSPGEVSCFLSHHKLWEEVAKSDEPMVILEDDALISEKLPELLNQFEELTGIDRINLEARIKRKLLSKRSRKIGSHQIHRLFLDRSGSAGYVLWPSGARKLLETFENKAALADKALRHFSLNSWQIEPAVVVPTDYAHHFGIRDPLKGDSTIPAPKKSSRKFRMACRRLGDQLMVAKLQLRHCLNGQKRLITVNPEEFNE